MTMQDIELIGQETDFKLSKLFEVSNTDKELIELQRKTIYLQRL